MRIVNRLGTTGAATGAIMLVAGAMAFAQIPGADGTISSQAGPAAPQGPAGSKAEARTAGPQGMAEVEGASRAQGPAGAQGPDGPTGAAAAGSGNNDGDLVLTSRDRQGASGSLQAKLAIDTQRGHTLGFRHEHTRPEVVPPGTSPLVVEASDDHADAELGTASNHKGTQTWFDATTAAKPAPAPKPKPTPYPIGDYTDTVLVRVEY